jgi:hypothetical protein
MSPSKTPRRTPGVARRGENNTLNDKKADSSNMECVAIAVHSGRRRAWPLTDHFERLLKEACPSHTYPVKHKLKDYSMMRNLMALGSLTQDKEPEEDPGRSDTKPFLKEDAVMTVYDLCPL